MRLVGDLMAGFLFRCCLLIGRIGVGGKSVLLVVKIQVVTSN